MIYTKPKKLIEESQGFTLIEVIVAIAVISIVSITFLQMFTVSAKTNALAQVSDMANAICIETVERYVNDPYEGNSKFLELFDDSEEAGSYILYYDGKFDRASAAKDPTSETEYKVKIMPAVIYDELVQQNYYPEPALDIEIENTISNLVIQDMGIGGYKINGVTIDRDKIRFQDINKTAQIPIHLDCNKINADKELKVENKLGKIVKDPLSTDEYTAIADFYLYNFGEYNIEISSVEGAVSKSEIRKGEQNMVRNHTTIQVVRLSDSRVMAEQIIDKYWIEDVTP